MHYVIVLANGTKILHMMDTKNILSDMCSVVDNPVRGFSRMELQYYDLRIIRKLKNTNNFQTCDMVKVTKNQPFQSNPENF